MATRLILLVALLHLGACQNVKVSIAPERRLVEVGKDVGFECGYQLPAGHDQPSVFWRKEGGNIPSSRSEKTSDGILILKRVQESDSGVYTCGVSSVARGQRVFGWARAVLTAVPESRRFKIAPEAIVLPQGRANIVQGTIGQSVDFECYATGHPQPYFNWRRASGKPLPAGRHFLSLGKLTILRLDANQDTDEYICTAINSYGRSEQRRYLLAGGSGWAAWGEWGLCSVSCGRGRQERSRRCALSTAVTSQYRNAVCNRRDSTREQRVCEPGACPPPPTTPPPTTRPAPTTAAPQTAPPTTRPPATPPPVEIIEGNYLGCWRDTYPIRVLPYGFRGFWNRQMIPQICIDHCQRYQYRYAGIQNGYECWCGGNYRTGGRLDERRCSRPCRGNPGLRCGGLNALTVYQVPQEIAERCQPTLWGAYNRPYRGCGLELQSRTRGLRNPQLTCDALPRLRQYRLVMIRPCRLADAHARIAVQPGCHLVLSTKAEYIIHHDCRSEEKIQMRYCLGSCGSGRCTYRRTSNRNVLFRCANGVKSIKRVAVINECYCRYH